MVSFDGRVAWSIGIGNVSFVAAVDMTFGAAPAGDVRYAELIVSQVARIGAAS